MAVYADAYARLSGCRSLDGHIPWTAADAYARRYGIEPFAFFEDVIFGFERIEQARDRMRAGSGNHDAG
ncbi:MAG: hypothetical protein ACR2P3_08685 [Geminicoccaceae bacterium]